MSKIALKLHRHGNEVLLGACDEDLLDSEFEEGDLYLKVSRSFYFAELVDEEVFINRLEACTIANLVGKKVVEIAIREGYVEESSVITIGGVPHAQLFRM